MMKQLKKYVGFDFPKYHTNNTIEWFDVFNSQADSEHETEYITYDFLEISAGSVSEARRHLFSILNKSWDYDYDLFSFDQILINVNDMNDPDKFKTVFLATYGEIDGKKMISIVNDNYDRWSVDKPWGFFNQVSDQSRDLFNELSEETKIQLHYENIKDNLMIYPLKIDEDMKKRKKYVGLYCPNQNSINTINWDDVFYCQADSEEEPEVVIFDFLKLSAGSVSEARQHLFSINHPSWVDNEAYIKTAFSQILINVCNLINDCDLEDSYELVFLENYGETESRKMITLVDDYYDLWEYGFWKYDFEKLCTPWDYFKNVSDQSIDLFNELSEETKMQLYYEGIEDNFLIFPLKRV